MVLRIVETLIVTNRQTSPIQTFKCIYMPRMITLLLSSKRLLLLKAQLNT